MQVQPNNIFMSAIEKQKSDEFWSGFDKNKVLSAYTIDVCGYGDKMVGLLSIRQKIAARLLDNKCDDWAERQHLYQLLEYYNEQIKSLLGI